MTKIEETLAMKNDERRGDEEDEYGASTVWVGLGLGLVVWHAGAGSLVIDYSGSVELSLFIYIRWEESDTWSFPSW